MSQRSDPGGGGFRELLMAVCGGGLTAALLWSFFDASRLAEGVGVGYWEAWPVAVAVGMGLALALTPLGLALGWGGHWSRAGLRLRRFAMARPATTAALVIGLLLGMIALSFATFASLAFYRQIFGSETVHQLALSISVPISALVVAALVAVSLAPLRALFERLGSSRSVFFGSAGLAAVLVFAWGFGLTRLGLEIWKNLSLGALTALVVVGAGVLLGAVCFEREKFRRVVAVAGLFTLPWGGIYLMSETSQSLRLALVYGDSGTGQITTWIDSNQSHQFASAEANRGQTAVCFPDVDPPRLGRIGQVSGDAPDIIWLTIDALRWDRTSMAGYERDTTPNLAKHATDAALFTWAYTPATSTRQTMRALFTGTHPSMIDAPRGPMWALTLPEEQLTIAQFLSAAGYHTAAFSSEENIFSTEYGGMKGFDVVDESPVEAKLELGYSAPRSIDLIIEQLRSHEEPQFVWSHLIEPHQPYRSGPDPVDFGPEDEDRYDGALHFVDGEVKRLLDFVAQRQEEHPTYLIISSDHGHAFGEHGTYHHGRTVYDVESRVPLIVWGPDIEASRHDFAVAILDIYATTFELAGLEIPQGSCSHSLADLLRDKDVEFEPRPVYLEQVPDYVRTHFSVGFIKDGFKLMVDPRADVIALFDLVDDPGESRNIADEHPERLDEMLRALRQYWRERGMEAEDYGI